MPTYCHSCPYNKYCKDLYLQVGSCPNGYSPIGQANIPANGSNQGNAEHTGHILEPAILVTIGKVAMNGDDYETSKECFEKILEIEPDHLEAGFLLKRVNYMINEENTGVKAAKPIAPNSASGNVNVNANANVPRAVAAYAKKQPRGSSQPEPHKGMLAMQEEKSIQIKAKAQMHIDPRMKRQDAENVYSVGHTYDYTSREDVSKNVAQVSKGSIMKSKGTMVAVGLAIVIIIMIVIGLWISGLLF